MPCLLKRISALVLTCSALCADVLLEGRVAYDYPTDSTTRDIMGSGVLYSLESSIRAYDQLYAWLSAGILPLSGRSLGGGYKTEMLLVPLGTGLKYFFETSFGDLYLGLGIVPAYLHTRDDSPFVVRSRNAWGVGGILKAGGVINLPYSLFLEPFLDYTYLKISFSSNDKTSGRTSDLSNLSAGGGIGYRF